MTDKPDIALKASSWPACTHDDPHIGSEPRTEHCAWPGCPQGIEGNVLVQPRLFYPDGLGRLPQYYEMRAARARLCFPDGRVTFCWSGNPADLEAGDQWVEQPTEYLYD